MIRRTVIKPMTDQPITVLLDHGPEGKETTAPNGSVDYQYIVNDDGGILWLPAPARAQLLRTGAQAGDLVQISKVQQGRNTAWNVRVVSDANEPAPAASSRMVAPRPQYANGNGQPQQQPAAAAPRRGGSPLAQCLCAAVDAAIEAADYARERNFSVTFLGGDIRAMANSLMINDERGAR